jgi:hypothetical protein
MGHKCRFERPLETSALTPIASKFETAASDVVGQGRTHALQQKTSIPRREAAARGLYIVKCVTLFELKTCFVTFAKYDWSGT